MEKKTLTSSTRRVLSAYRKVEKDQSTKRGGGETGYGVVRQVCPLWTKKSVTYIPLRERSRWPESKEVETKEKGIRPAFLAPSDRIAAGAGDWESEEAVKEASRGAAGWTRT